VEITAVTDADSFALVLDVSAVPNRPGGAGYYTMELARGLAGTREVDLTLIARRGDADRWRSIAGPDVSVRAAVPPARPARLVYEQVGFPALLRSVRARVHHGPHYTMPARAPVPCVVTIHDCTFFDHPEWHLRTKAAFFRRAIRNAARQAAALVCVSHTTAARLSASCEVRAPVVVAPHGVDLARFTPVEPAVGSDREQLDAFGIPDGRPLVVFVGTLEPRKGVVPLVSAFDRVADAYRDAVLVLGGQTGWGLTETERALAEARHGERIVRTGYLPDAAVPALLRRAAVVAYPAYEEGFGLPALEALACGAPLVTTEGTAMAEFAGEAALLVRPGDAPSLADALEQALRGEHAASRRERGLELARRQTWAASLAAHQRAYAMALSASL
jgi:glycosyltransferase involved in cell wall biosynthesis